MSPVDVPHGDIAFVLSPEPSRTHADQVRSAEKVAAAMEVVIAALDAGAVPSKARQGRNDDPTWALPLPGSGAAWMKDRQNGRIRLQVSLDGNWTACTCSVVGAWRKPTADRYRRAAELFLLAARAVSDPAPGAEAATRLRRSVIAELANGGTTISVSASLPWELPLMTCTGPGSHAVSEIDAVVPTRHVASLVCADTVDGALLEIERFSVTVRADEIGMVETMRAVSKMATAAG